MFWIYFGNLCQIGQGSSDLAVDAEGVDLKTSLYDLRPRGLTRVWQMMMNEYLTVFNFERHAPVHILSKNYVKFIQGIKLM
jgi:hypothetical protein